MCWRCDLRALRSWLRSFLVFASGMPLVFVELAEHVPSRRWRCQRSPRMQFGISERQVRKPTGNWFQSSDCTRRAKQLLLLLFFIFLFLLLFVCWYFHVLTFCCGLLPVFGGTLTCGWCLAFGRKFLWPQHLLLKLVNFALSTTPWQFYEWFIQKIYLSLSVLEN